jgi:hypothetical protein
MKTSFAEMEFRIMKLDQEGCIVVRSIRQTSVSFQGRSAVIDCGSDASVSRLNSARNVAFGVFMGRSFVQSIVPSGHDQAVYLVINNFGNLGAAFPETDVDKADLETVIGDLMSGQYSDSVRVFAFDTGEHWPDDASEDVAREIMRRLDLAGDALPSSIAAFVDRHLGPDCQLTLRLA